MNLGYYALLAADTRVTSCPPGQTPVWRDDEEKVQVTNLGIITGMGLCELLDPVKERLSAETLTNTDGILEIIRTERARIDARCPQESWLRPHIEHVTSWMFTFVECDNPNSPTPDSLRLRLAGCHPKDDYDISLYLPPAVAIGLPNGITEERAAPIRQALADNFRPMRDWSEFRDNLGHHVDLACAVIHALSEVSKSVSPYCQIGVHSIRLGTSVSEISQDGRVSFTFSQRG